MIPIVVGSIIRLNLDVPNKSLKVTYNVSIPKPIPYTSLYLIY